MATERTATLTGSALTDLRQFLAQRNRVCDCEVMVVYEVDPVTFAYNPANAPMNFRVVHEAGCTATIEPAEQPPPKGDLLIRSMQSENGRLQVEATNCPAGL